MVSFQPSINYAVSRESKYILDEVPVRVSYDEDGIHWEKPIDHLLVAPRLRRLKYRAVP